MQNPAYTPLYGDRRIAFNQTISFFGIALSSSTAKMDIRTAPDAPGAALVDLATGSGLTLAYAGTATVAAHIAAGRITRDDLPVEGGYSELADTDNLALTQISIHISAATMALAAAPPVENGDNVELAYDLLITPSGSDEEKYLYGPFILRGTVTS